MWTQAHRATYKQSGTALPSDLSDAQWERLEPLISAAKPGGRPRKTDMRAAMNAIFYLLRTGCPWRYLPRGLFPPRSTVYNIFRQFQRDGVWERIWEELHMALREALDREASPSAAIIDSQSLKAAEKGEPRAGLMSIPGFGPITASAMAATIQDTTSFAGPREFAAFLGLTPKQNSSGGKPKLGRISKMGNRYLRKLLVVGAHAVLFHRKPHTDPLRMWAKKLIDKKPFKLVAVALANKMARIAFAILRGKTVYREIPA